MATIGTLAVNVIAVTDKFTKGLASAGSSIDKFVSNIGGMQAAVIGLATGAIASFVSSTIELGGKLQELTSKLRISSEALTALHYAANLLESSAGAVDAAIAKMQVTLGKAGQGVDAATAAFNRLGIDYRKLLDLPVEEQFLKIIDALHKIPDATAQAAAAQAIFGKGSKELSALIAAGGDKIVEYGQKAAEAGAIVSTDTVAALDDAGDSIASFSQSWDAMKMQVVSVAAPAIKVAMDVLTFAIVNLKAAWFLLQAGVIGGVELIYNAMATVVKGMGYIGLASKETLADVAYGSQLLADARLAAYNKAHEVATGGANPLANNAATDVSGHVATNKEVGAEAKAKAADKKEEEKKLLAEAKLQTEHNKLMLKATQANKPPQLAVAGVR